VTFAVIAAAGYSTIETRQQPEEIIAFGCSFAIATAIAPLPPLVLGSRRAWATELIFAVIGFIVIIVGTVYVMLWLVPSVTLRIINLGLLLDLREIALRIVVEIGVTWGPPALAIGMIVGIIGGLVALLARRVPRVAVAVAVILVLLGASGVANQSIFGRGADLVLRWRKRPGLWKTTSQITSIELTSVLGGTAGAFAGVSAAGLALWHGRKTENALRSKERRDR
jgi:hypothetical protein